MYSAKQVQRVLVGSGVNIENELENDFLVFCPYHNNFRTPAAEVNKESGMFFCFSCQQTADLIELVMHTSRRTYFEAARFIKDKESKNNLLEDIDDTLNKKDEFVPFDGNLINMLHMQALTSQRALDYYHGRKITDESIKKFMLGYSEKQDMVTIPVQSPEGMNIGFVGRSVEGKSFKNSQKLPKSKTLFNLHRVSASRHVCVVESSFDAIRLDQVGIPAVATLGAGVSSVQADLLQKYFNEVILIADNDEAGRTMITKLSKKLGDRLSVFELENKYKDIGDMDDDSLRALNFGFDNVISSMLN